MKKISPRNYPHPNVSVAKRIFTTLFYFFKENWLRKKLYLTDWVNQIDSFYTSYTSFVTLKAFQIREMFHKPYSSIIIVEH